jgi:hypothetical protein
MGNNPFFKGQIWEKEEVRVEGEQRPGAVREG